MKKTCKIFFVSAFLFAVILNAEAQDQTVLGSSTHKYAVDSSDTETTLQWSVSGGIDTLIQSTTGGSAIIVWDNAPGEYTITMMETNEANGTECSTPNQFTVKVLESGKLSFAETESIQCADGEDITLDLTYSGAITAEMPITIIYKINDGPENTLTFTENSELIGAITISGPQYRSDFDAVPPTDRTVNVIITDVNDGVDISTGCVHTHTVSDIPEANEIFAL